MTTTLRELSLAHLSVLDATPPELVTVAAAAGFRKIGIRLSATPSVGVPPDDMLGDTPVLRETLARLADTGVSVVAPVVSTVVSGFCRTGVSAAESVVSGFSRTVVRRLRSHRD